MQAYDCDHAIIWPHFCMFLHNQPSVPQSYKLIDTKQHCWLFLMDTWAFPWVVYNLFQHHCSPGGQLLQHSKVEAMTIIISFLKQFVHVKPFMTKWSSEGDTVWLSILVLRIKMENFVSQLYHVPDTGNFFALQKYRIWQISQTIKASANLCIKLY